MKVFIFDLLAYGKHFDQYKATKYLPYPLPKDHFDPETAARTYEEHLQIWQEMDRLGYDGVGLNEHHTTPHGLMNSPNMMAAVGAQRTKKLKFLLLGNLVPLHNPLRIAEELAMADCLSKGRILSGFARGVPREYNVYGVKMGESRARFEEAVDIIMKAWTEPVFSYDILVAAVFDAFLTIYGKRTEDLLRIGGVTRGEIKRLDADLTARLTREAAKTADHVLRMCMRALDYMPPVDVRFGEFLRGIITADTDLVPIDTYNYRVAFAEAFRRRGIMVADCLSMSPENLLWESPEQMLGKNPLNVATIEKIGLELQPYYGRDKIIEVAEENRSKVWHWLVEPDPKKSTVDRAWEKALGVYFMQPERLRLGSIDWGQGPKVEVHSVRATRRSGPDGQDVRQLVIEVAQRRRAYVDPAEQKSADRGPPRKKADFIFRGGATLIIDLRENRLRYIMRKRIDDEDRLQEQRELLSSPDGFGFTYLPDESGSSDREPFAMAHRGR